ncbi:MAG TPA: hypothetical protein VNE67_10925 [Acetobacteraceae bacterium]|nr:hypothetical protein [Acetobacteraceae bacterium]
MRVLTAATIAMGVLILLGTTVLVVTIIHRTTIPHPVAPTEPVALTLHEPAGTAIAGIADAGGWLAIALHGGGPDRVVLVDPRSGAVAGRVALRP